MQKKVLKEVAEDSTCDFCRENKENLSMIGPFAMELPTQICASCYHECLGEFDRNNNSVAEWLESSNSEVNDIGWEIMVQIHGRSLEIKEPGVESDSFISVGEMPPKDAEYILFKSNE